MTLMIRSESTIRNPIGELRREVAETFLSHETHERTLEFSTDIPVIFRILSSVSWVILIRVIRVIRGFSFFP
jgi:hypothetical protein